MSQGDMNIDMDMDMNMPMPMHKSFYWGKDVTVLFSGWPENDSGMYVLAFLFVMSLGVVSELMSMLSSMIKPGTKPVVGAFVQASIYVVKMCFAYMVMLSVMSYNIGIFVAAVAGHGIGFFFVKFRALSKDPEQLFLDPDGMPSKC